jgi:hypothetical protein
MVAIAAPKPILAEPEFSDAALREFGAGMRFVSRIRFDSEIAPRLIAEDYGDVPAGVAVSNGRAIEAGNGVIFAAYRVFGSKAMDDVIAHIFWRIGDNPSIHVRLAAETMEAG